ncbi:hypothetical protein PPYR_09931 [Photinus pyralis]|uniref:Peptidase M13 N-terminal domain-containing protein n=1 Tax=Photinus pyralis TaxID=7054 RepID=A0A5N4AEW2_PHOPY|nr:hypothetical protein PPYR_09931 [Photinus pyralis]
MASEESVKQTNKNGTDSPKINEPAEDDPCIEIKSSLDKPRFLVKTENQLREKTGLSRLGLYIAIVLLIVLIILVIIVLSLAIAWPNIPHSAQFSICQDPACLRAAAQVQESWNSSVSPCEDVWGWACGRWLQNNPLPIDRSFWSERQKRQRDESVRIHNLISTLELPLHSQTVEWKMKYLYEGCLDMDNINVEKALPLKRIISELGTFYFFPHSFTSLMEFNL